MRECSHAYERGLAFDITHSFDNISTLAHQFQQNQSMMVKEHEVRSPTLRENVIKVIAEFRWERKKKDIILKNPHRIDGI